MRTPRPRPGRPAWLRLPRRTARLRLTALYGAAFLVCGAGSAAVLSITFLLYWVTTHAAHLDVPSASPLRPSEHPSPTSSGQVATTCSKSRRLRPADRSLRRAQRPRPGTQAPRPAGTSPSSAVAHAKVTIVGLGQFTVDRQELLIASVIALAVIVAGAAVIGWFWPAGCCAR